MSGYRSQRITQAMRQEVARRLNAVPGRRHWRLCEYCGALIVVDWTDEKRVRFLDTKGRSTPELDHVEPLAHGGSHTADNLALACLTCNRRKGTRRREQ